MKKKLVEVEIELPLSVAKRLLRICKQLDTTPDEFIEEALKIFLKEFKKSEKEKQE